MKEGQHGGREDVGSAIENWGTEAEVEWWLLCLPLSRAACLK